MELAEKKSQVYMLLGNAQLSAHNDRLQETGPLLACSPSPANISVWFRETPPPPGINAAKKPGSFRIQSSSISPIYGGEFCNSTGAMISGP